MSFDGDLHLRGGAQELSRCRKRLASVGANVRLVVVIERVADIFVEQLRQSRFASRWGWRWRWQSDGDADVAVGGAAGSGRRNRVCRRILRGHARIALSRDIADAGRKVQRG